MPTQDQLTAIQKRLQQGYFLKEDMDTLGLTGPVSLAAVRAKVMAAIQPAAQPIDNAALNAQNQQASLQAEIQAAKDRAAIIDGIAAKEAAARQALADQQALADTVKRFQDAIKADPNVQTS